MKLVKDKCKPELIQRLLSNFKEAKESPQDTALWHLLKDNIETLPCIDGYFHKAFRQVDVCNNGHVDMAIYHLLQQSNTFWECFRKLEDGLHRTTQKLDVIDSFSGEYSWLSNFYPSSFRTPGSTHVYKTVEHFYQCSKAHNHQDFLNILECTTPGRAKRMGRKINLRPDWTDEIAIEKMSLGIYWKFTTHEELAQKLLNTGESLLVEGNNWHDNYWGACQCEPCNSQILAQNKLGEILMKLRNRLKENRR